ncbi:Polyamine transporter 4 [Exophiala dermatitidis]
MEKTTAPSDSTTGSNGSTPVPVAIAEQDLEKHATTTGTGTATAQQGNGPSPPTATVHDWDGPDDPEAPLNWSLLKKSYHSLFPALQCLTITFGASVITPSIPEIARHFDVSITAAIVTLTVYVIGLAFGPVISAPLSETYGRRGAYLVFFPSSLFFTLGAGFAKNFGTLVVCRFFAGLLGSGCLAVGAGSNSDIFSPYQRAVSGVLFVMTPFLGPALGPAIGGYVAMKKGWRWTQWLTLFWGALSYAVTIPQKETYKKIILQRRAKKLGLPPAPSPLPPGMSPIKFLLIVTLLRPLRMLGTESIVAFTSIYTAFNFSVLFGFFAAFPLVFESFYPEIQVYHFNEGESGLVFLGIGLGVVLGTLAFIGFDLFIYRKKMRSLMQNGQAGAGAGAGAVGEFVQLPPEKRLYAAMVGSFMLPIGLFWFAWSARPSVHWIVPVLATIPFGMGNMLVFCSGVCYLVDAYGPLMGASAIAANALLRYVVGGVFPLFTIQMYRGMGVAWATSLFGFVTVGLLPIPWVLYKYGPIIRRRSAYT